MPRLFVAAWPPSGAADVLAALPRDGGDRVRMVLAENWHITLRFLGETDADPVRERLRATAFPRATATLGPSLEHLGPRQIVAPVTGVDALARAVTDATADLGDRSRRNFVGHLTVARLPRSARSTLVGVPIVTSFVVEEIALIVSELTDAGAVYTTIDTYPTS